MYDHLNTRLSNLENGGQNEDNKQEYEDSKLNPNQLPPKWVKNKCVSKCLNSSKTNNAIKKFLGGDIFDT